MNFRILVLFLFYLFISVPLSFAQSKINDLGFSGQFFFSYDHHFMDDEVYNEFLLKRGYITFRRDLHERIGIRFTQDITIDQEGDGEGDIELRLKYALIYLSLNDLSFIKNPQIELGVISRPWIDFEQGINDFRSQKSMFLDNNDILTSADYGISLAGDLGEELPEHVRESLGSGGGRYGSFHLGLFNGGGYSALEKNNNKLIEARLTLRPLPDHLPGLQTSFFGAYGKGNIPESPDFRLTGSGISFESTYWTTLLQGFYGTGDGRGFLTDDAFRALPIRGWSTFHELKPFAFPISILARYGRISDRDNNNLITQKVLGGIAYSFPNRSKIILSLGHRDDLEPFETQDFTTLSIITEVRF